jgi:hypothetical protein
MNIPRNASRKLKLSSPNKQTFRLPSAVKRNRLHPPQKLLKTKLSSVCSEFNQILYVYLDIDVMNPILAGESVITIAEEEEEEEEEEEGEGEAIVYHFVVSEGSLSPLNLTR